MIKLGQSVLAHACYLSNSEDEAGMWLSMHCQPEINTELQESLFSIVRMYISSQKVLK